jgi:flagellar protein FliS
MTTQGYNKNEFLAYTTAKENVSKSRQVVMLYDGVISFIQRAFEAKQNKDFQEHYNFLNKAGKIIQGLHQSLDHENGGNVSQILNDFYTITFSRIMALFQPVEDDQYESLARDVKTMRDAWEEVDQKNSAKNETIDDDAILYEEPKEEHTPSQEEVIEQALNDAPPINTNFSVSV